MESMALQVGYFDWYLLALQVGYFDWYFAESRLVLNRIIAPFQQRGATKGLLYSIII